MIDEIKNKLSELTGKKNIVLTRRGNKALKFTLKALKETGKKKLAIQNQGGWITYRQYGEALKLNVTEINTNYGLVYAKDLKEKVDEDTIVLINSMPGYFAYEDMKAISEITKEKKAVLVNDVSGSIGTEEGKIGDILFGSLGRWKPVDVGYGGFIATDDDEIGNMPSVFDEKWHAAVAEKLDNLGKRTEALKTTAKKVKDDLKDFDIIHPEQEGFNVIVKFSTDEEKEKILNYCSKNNLEHTICPRYIRVNADAVCIEVKRNG